MALPEPFSTASPILTNYNWIDVAEGTGYVVFYGVGMDTRNHILTTQTLVAGDDAYNSYDEPDYPNAAYLSTDPAKRGNTVDFLLTPFNTPKIIDGDCIITYSIGASTSAGGYGLNFKFYKNDELIVSDGVRVPNAAEGKNYNAKITIPQTNFSVGDQLEIVAEETFSGEDHDDQGFYLYHDPSDSDTNIGYATPSHAVLKFAIPFRIEL